MIHMGLPKTKIRSPSLCFCVFVINRDLEMGSAFFYGKIGCFPLVTYEPAQRGNAASGRVQ
jgi:hypothetical protein